MAERPEGAGRVRTKSRATGAIPGTATEPGETGIMRTWCMAAQRHGLACRERGFNSRCSHQGNHIYLFSQPRKRFKIGWQPGTDWYLPADEKAVLRAVLTDSVISGFNSPRWAGVTEGIPGTPDGNVGRCAPGELRSWQPGKTGIMRHCCKVQSPPDGRSAGGAGAGSIPTCRARRFSVSSHPPVGLGAASYK